MMNEQQRTDEFEALCGGVEKAQRVMSLWNSCYPMATYYGVKSKEAVFLARAKREGYSNEIINAFLALH